MYIKKLLKRICIKGANCCKGCGGIWNIRLEVGWIVTVGNKQSCCGGNAGGIGGDFQ